jgi:hypothetical protein
MAMAKAGNLDPSKPIAFVKNKDGTTSTVRTISANFGGGEVVIPTVHPDGFIMSNKEAIDRRKQVKTLALLILLMKQMPMQQSCIIVKLS